MAQRIEKHVRHIYKPGRFKYITVNLSFNKTIGILSLLLLCSCNYLGKQQTKEIIAIVNDHVLYEEDVKNILPSNLTKEDSTVFVRAYIEDWAMDNILMDNAKFNLPLNEQERYQKMVDKYKSELFKKAYLDALIQQQSANKSIDSSSIAEYYELNKKNFKLNETLVKIRYVYAKNTLKDLISSSVQYRMVSDVPYGTFLSGGIDSSIVTALLQKKKNRQIKTFTIGFHDKEYNEAQHAKAVAKHLGTDHHELYCTTEDFEQVIPLLPEIYDEPFGEEKKRNSRFVGRDKTNFIAFINNLNLPNPKKIMEAIPANKNCGKIP